MVSVRDLDANVAPLSEPHSDEPQLESVYHLRQLVLLLSCLEWWWRDRQNFFAAGNLSIYWQPEDIGKRWTERQFIGPDFFVVLNVDSRPRNSWMVSLENGRFPNVIVELLSKSTARKDRTAKKTLYQDVFKTPEYFWFHPDPQNQEFRGFRLENGTYQEIVPNAQGWRWSEELELYLGIADEQLRYFAPDGTMVPTPAEDAMQQKAAIAHTQEQLQQVQQHAEAERERAEKLAERLRSLGIDPNAL
ncbi:Uma2 family endonuclease [Thermoleptolyngbya oregonensis NK1-22]|uniref:Uma2 family endonuclease n=1 Tax=Thermoleptolyngbya oregonensis NK1-22 TaxID=2547457 RepID=A0AA96Y341_9CYAN|nr:Uma2 family endonuclease [Thermoleptolyngbya oregonensis]WOB42856.1 Uma2 family endonuclease [Thermoleptolyngbya oregonensis NK1-22]